jgi:hypothetical protein
MIEDSIMIVRESYDLLINREKTDRKFLDLMY